MHEDDFTESPSEFKALVRGIVLFVECIWRGIQTRFGVIADFTLAWRIGGDGSKRLLDGANTYYLYIFCMTLCR